MITLDYDATVTVTTYNEDRDEFEWEEMTVGEYLDMYKRMYGEKARENHEADRC